MIPLKSCSVILKRISQDDLNKSVVKKRLVTSAVDLMDYNNIKLNRNNFNFSDHPSSPYIDKSKPDSFNHTKSTAIVMPSISHSLRTITPTTADLPFEIVTVPLDSKKVYQLEMEVEGIKPHLLVVKSVGQQINISAKSEFGEDFQQSVIAPEDFLVKQMKCVFSNGVIRIQAPISETCHRVLPVDPHDSVDASSCGRLEGKETAAEAKSCKKRLRFNKKTAACGIWKAKLNRKRYVNGAITKKYFENCAGIDSVRSVAPSRATVSTNTDLIFSKHDSVSINADSFLSIAAKEINNASPKVPYMKEQLPDSTLHPPYPMNNLTCPINALQMEAHVNKIDKNSVAKDNNLYKTIGEKLNVPTYESCKEGTFLQLTVYVSRLFKPKNVLVKIINDRLIRVTAVCVDEACISLNAACKSEIETSEYDQPSVFLDSATGSLTTELTQIGATEFRGLHESQELKESGLGSVLSTSPQAKRRVKEVRSLSTSRFTRLPEPTESSHSNSTGLTKSTCLRESQEVNESRISSSKSTGLHDSHKLNKTRSNDSSKVTCSKKSRESSESTLCLAKSKRSNLCEIAKSTITGNGNSVINPNDLSNTDSLQETMLGPEDRDVGSRMEAKLVHDFHLMHSVVRESLKAVCNLGGILKIRAKIKE